MLLTAGSEKSWAVTDLTENGTSKLFDYFDACELDDKLIFNINGKVAFDFGKDSCTGEAEIPETDEWILYDSETKLRLGIEPYNLIKLDNSTLIISPTSEPSIQIALTSK